MTNREDYILKNANKYAEMGVRRGQNLQANLMRDIILSTIRFARRLSVRTTQLVHSYNPISSENRS